MATTKTLNTRIQLKYDSYAEWSTKNPTLLAGEIAIATIESADKQAQNPPTVLFKVGPGAFNSLDWISAKAADVYSWAILPYEEFLVELQKTFYTETEVNNLIAQAEGRAATDAKSKADTAEANADEIARVNGILVNAIENNAEGLDSIKELADWINNHGTTVSGLTEAIEKNAEDILANANAIKTINETTIPALEEEVKAYADTAVANFAASEFIFNGGNASTNLWTEAAAE